MRYHRTTHGVGMTKAELVEQTTLYLDKKFGPTVSQREASRVVDAFLESITVALSKGERIEIRDFGVFVTKHRAPRKARNPRTKKMMTVPARLVPTFSPSKTMRARIDTKKRKKVAV